MILAGANYPSAWLGTALFWLGDRLHRAFAGLGAPLWLGSLLFDGVWRTAAWVVSVMLPPMAIFFPLFTLLEDLGYLPRVAFNLDGLFRRCAACGKQGLTMCMALGCNAAAVTNCRIIDSARERLIAILTNNFMPCNGRFPILIALIGLFFAGTGTDLPAALLLTAVLLFSVGMTLLASKLLSATLLRGVPSSFTLELPPYRRPQLKQVLIRSVLDRTLFVLGRAVTAAAPAGLLIWLLANLSVGDHSLLVGLRTVLDPVAALFGLDGAILLAFLLGLPANEIVIPLVLLCYTAGGSLTDYGTLAELGELLAANGWSAATALCVILFTVLHWPCATTLLTIRKETGSAGWTAFAAVLPTVFGLLLCLLVNGLTRLLIL